MTMTRPTSEQITHNGQILKDVLGPVYTLTSFGAKGDGVTDDMDALIAAVNAVKAAGGGTLYIPRTANGYYLRYGAFADIGTGNISIVSDGATLKLQGGTSSQTLSTPVFFGGQGFSTGVTNVTIRGLQFVAASTVLRYGNGGSSGAIHFDAEVDAGRANPLEQTTFRYCISFSGTCSNVRVEDCYFGTGIFLGVTIKNAAAGQRSSGIKYANLTFDGVCQQCMQLFDCDNVIIENIVSLNHQGSRFDWTLYAPADCNDLAMNNIIVRNDILTPDFGCGAIGLAQGAINVVISNLLIENIGSNPIRLGGSTSHCLMSNVYLLSCGSATQPAINFAETTNQVSITNLLIRDCPWGIAFNNSRNSSIRGFLIENATDKALEVFSGVSSLRMSDGMFLNCGDSSNRTIRIASNANQRRLWITNVDFVFDSYVPALSVSCIWNTDPNCVVEVSGCSFTSLFGSSAGFPLGGSTSNLRINNCTQTGFAALVSGAFDAGVLVAELPTKEVTLVANDATPNVANAALCVTANTSATAYTNFTNGVQGQEICIRVNDANTTFDFSGTNIKGNNGVDFSAASGDVIFAKKIGSNWYCTVVEA